MDQLNANDDGLNSTNHEKQQGRENVQNSKAFVIDRGEPLMKLVDPGSGFDLDAGDSDHVRGHRHSPKVFNAASPGNSRPHPGQRRSAAWRASGSRV